MTAWRVQRASSRRASPWRNGGGETAEVAAEPAGAGYDSFHWRVSLARIDRAGPFSRFPGVARTIAMLEGRALRLRFAGGAAETLHPGDPPRDFAGETEVLAVPEGRAVVLNAMSRRGSGRHRVARHVLPCEALAFDDAAILIASAPVVIEQGGERIALGSGDALVCARGIGPLRPSAAGGAALWSVSVGESRP